MRHRFTAVEVLIIAAIVLIVAISLWNALTCARWERDGGMSCTGSSSSGTLICTPTQVCVERR